MNGKNYSNRAMCALGVLLILALLALSACMANPIEVFERYITGEESDTYPEEETDFEAEPTATTEAAEEGKYPGSEGVPGSLGQPDDKGSGTDCTVPVDCSGGVNVQARDEDLMSAACRPDVIVYGTPDEGTLPEGFTVNHSSGGGPSAHWRVMQQAGDWVEASTTRNVTDVGAEVFGDSSIGWARVSVDGTTMWEGDTYGHWTDGSNWAVYVQVSCLPAGPHTIRVECMGMPGAGAVPPGSTSGSVPVFAFGFELANP